MAELFKRQIAFVVILGCIMFPWEIIKIFKTFSTPGETEQDIEIIKNPCNTPDLKPIQRRETSITMIDFVKEVNKKDKEEKKEEVIEIK